MKRSDVTIGLAEMLERDRDNNFSALISQSIRELKNRKLISKRGTTIGLTKEGRETTRIIIDKIKEVYNDIDWDIINCYYHEVSTYS